MRKRIITGNAQTTIRAEFEEWVRGREGMVVPKTIKTYWSHFKGLEKFISMDQELTEAACLDLYGRVMRSGLSEASKWSYLKTWKTFLSDRDDLPKPKIKQPEAPKQVYTEEEIKKLIQKPTKRDYVSLRNYAIIVLLIETGIRASTLINIKISDVNLQQRYLVTRHNKTNKSILVPFGELSKQAICKIIQFIQGNSEYLFISVYGTPLSVEGLRTIVERYNESKGIKLNSVHAFRHTYAREFLKKSKNVFLLQKLLGHSTLKMSEHYAKIFDQDVLEGYVSPVEGLERKRRV